jgi:type II secretory pathway component PulM
MDLFSIKAGPAYTLGLIGMFLAAFLLVAGVYHVIINPLLQRHYVKRRLHRGRNQRLNQIQILKNVQEIEGSPLTAIARSIGALGKIENLQRNLLQADI